MKNKGYLQISFGWLFAIIVGAFILFIAIYATTKFISTEETTLAAKAGKEIGVLLNPLETSFETVKATFFTMPVETRIYNKCNNYGDFGKQIIQVSQKSFGKWTETDIDIGFANKYIFSDKDIEGKKFYIFSKPFEFPFKVADLIYIIPSTERYCFVSPPEYIEDEIDELDQENLLLEEDCSENDVKVCFNSGGCDINVWENAGYIEKDGEKVYFESDALMYAGIFADQDVYECQIKRLMKRTNNLALLYRNKAIFISRTGCHSNLNLLALSNSVESLSNSASLGSIAPIVEDIKEQNDLANCKLW